MEENSVIKEFELLKEGFKEENLETSRPGSDQDGASALPEGPHRPSRRDSSERFRATGAVPPFGGRIRTRPMPAGYPGQAVRCR
nr:unnamed protein product [Callosobruchus analis]